jgi:iron complex outermembrane receptor protein
MNARYSWNRSTWLVVCAAASLSLNAMAQTAAASSATPSDQPVKLEKFVVTGSMIKRIADEGALPLSVFTKLELEQEGIASAEQLIMNLNVNGNGLDNLASNADVVAGAQRGNNGASAANLRGQGANATLILLNGRRVASHGLNGGVVDLNSIPFAAIERVEVLKDGASAIYGTDAIGGVINFITKRDFQGLVANASSDVTQDGGGNVFRYSVVGGWGDLNRDKWNIMASLALSDSKRLDGADRDFVNTFQPNRGISPDTRGTPVATLFTVANLPTALGLSTANPVDPANPAIRVNGINIIDLPTNTAGYAGFDGMGPYQEILWGATAATGNGKYGSAWDTGRAAVLQQPVKNTNFVGRGSFKLGEHLLTLEAVLGRSDSTKSFSPNQWSTAGLAASGAQTTTTTANGTVVPNPLSGMVYPSTGADYNRVFNALVAFFPALEVNRGLPLAFRWRSLPAGNREINTVSDTRRFLGALEGPLPFLADWDYRLGVSQSESKSKSKLLNGYYYTVPFAKLITDGILSPFSYTQTEAAMNGLKAASATGVELYGGTFTTTGADFATSGPIFTLPGGTVQAALGLDWRKEEYFFAGDKRANISGADSLIFNVPFDNALATAGTLSRTTKAVFAELQIPVLKNLDLNLAGRRDDYTGFGATTNPKVTLRFVPVEQVLVRGSYSTGFRIPTFKQQFDPSFESIYAGVDLIDPATGIAIPANSLNTISGGKADLQPEDAKMKSVGIVISPVKNITFGVDWWSVNRTGTIQVLGTSVILANSALFPDRIIRASGTSSPITKIDIRPLNAGETETKGLEYTARGEFDVWGGKLVGDLNVSQLLEKKSRLIQSAPFGASEVGKFTRASDIGLKWKYTASVSYRKDKWTARVSQLYRAGYMDYVPPGILNGTFLPFAPDYNPKVDEYITYNASFTYRWNKDLTLIAGVKNLLNQDPPFSIAYDTNTGAGSSWEPRVADPRGRAFTLSVEYKFK